MSHVMHVLILSDDITLPCGLCVSFFIVQAAEVRLQAETAVNHCCSHVYYRCNHVMK